MKKCNIPVFIPHAGCPHDCVFCDQKRITGEKEPMRDVRAAVDTALASMADDAEREIAFFGGSFTGIDRNDMISYLETATEYVRRGQVSGIRLSTRPDYINGEILDILSHYPVHHIELGVQSTCDRVLAASERGHSAEQAEQACRAVVSAGFSLTGQMMIGLPQSSMEDELQTARDLCAWGAQSARVYPTVVLRGTKLERMQKSGAYLPLSQDENIQRTAAVLEILEDNGLDILRVGLCATEILCDPENAPSFDPAIGEKARSEIFYHRIRAYLDAHPAAAENAVLHITCPAKKASQVAGQNRSNLHRIAADYPLQHFKITESDLLSGYQIICEIHGKENCR